MKRDRYGRQIRAAIRAGKMTEEERLRAAHRFERHLQKMDADRLGEFDLMKIDWVAVILIAMAAFCAFYFLRWELL